jgi:hypothetical protein
MDSFLGGGLTRATGGGERIGLGLGVELADGRDDRLGICIRFLDRGGSGGRVAGSAFGNLDLNFGLGGGDDFRGRSDAGSELDSVLSLLWPS